MKLFMQQKITERGISTCCCCILCGLIILNLWTIFNVGTLMGNILSMATLSNYIKQHNDDGTIYVLSWKNRSNDHTVVIDRRDFSSLNCTFSNCIFTQNTPTFDEYLSKFDAIVFSHSSLKSGVKPSQRPKSQIYIFASRESAYDHPACDMYNDDFFNLTFTYKLDSTVPYPFFYVVNASTGDVVAPKMDVNWKTSTSPVSPDVLPWLSKKRKAVALVDDSGYKDKMTNSYVTKLKEKLFELSLKIDIFPTCSKKLDKEGYKKIVKNDYYFYIAFEDSISEDYLSDKVIFGYENYAVPIVYGGANYSRFLPPGSYINARETDPEMLASMISRAVNDTSLLEKYFKWRNLYSIESTSPKKGLKMHHPWCNLCEALNKWNNAQTPAVQDFRSWWNGLDVVTGCLNKKDEVRLN